MSRLLARLFQNPRELLLVDACGALITSAAMALVAVAFASEFGLPRGALVPLSAVAAAFSAFSFVSHRAATDPRPRLRIIAAANLSYCAATIGLMFVHRATLTGLGLAYFAGEISLVCALAAVELRAASKTDA